MYCEGIIFLPSFVWEGHFDSQIPTHKMWPNKSEIRSGRIDVKSKISWQTWTKLRIGWISLPIFSSILSNIGLKIADISTKFVCLHINSGIGNTYIYIYVCIWLALLAYLIVMAVREKKRAQHSQEINCRSMDKAANFHRRQFILGFVPPSSYSSKARQWSPGHVWSAFLVKYI